MGPHGSVLYLSSLSVTILNAHAECCFTRIQVTSRRWMKKVFSVMKHNFEHRKSGEEETISFGFFFSVCDSNYCESSYAKHSNLAEFAIKKRWEIRKSPKCLTESAHSARASFTHIRWSNFFSHFSGFLSFKFTRNRFSIAICLFISSQLFSDALVDKCKLLVQTHFLCCFVLLCVLSFNLTPTSSIAQRFCRSFFFFL